MANRLPMEIENKLLSDLNNGLDLTDISKAYNISKNSLRRTYNRLGIKSFIPSKKVKLDKHDIENINDKYKNGTSATKLAIEYGVETGTITKILRKDTNLRNNKGSNHPFWKGGKGFKHGRPVVRVPDHHRAMNNGMVWEHILVMEDSIKREVTQEEHIHHINLDPTDNTITNLFLCMNNSEHITIHNQLIKLIKELVSKDLITFDVDLRLYKLKENIYG